MSDHPAHPELHLAAPTLKFALAAELAQMRATGAWQQSGRHARTLVKEGALRIVLIALRSGANLEEHQAHGPVSLHVIEGRLRVQTPAQTLELGAGELLALAADLRHDVTALAESALLLTITQPEG
jgi:quercetin dioxygenase-like cupin family protein